MNVGEDTTLGNGDMTQKLVQLLIVSDGELKMTRDDTGLLVVARSVASELENLSSEVLENGGEVDGSTGTDTLGVVTLAEETVNTADGESQTGLGRSTEGRELARIKLKRADTSLENRMKSEMERCVTTYDCAFLEPLALPPDLPPPVILKVRGFFWVENVKRLKCVSDARSTEL